MTLRLAKHLRKSDCSTGLVEYGLITLCMMLMAVAVLAPLGHALVSLFSTIGNF